MSSLGRIFHSEDDGADVDFFKEVKENFFVKQEENKDVAFVSKNEMVALSEKCLDWSKDGRLYGVRLKEGVKSICLEKLGLS